MIKTALALICLISVFFACASAQEQAASLIKPTTCSFSGEFNQQKSLQGLDLTLESNGVFFYDCHHGIIWKTVSPIIESLVLNQSNQSYLVKRLKIEPIQSDQNKLLGQLIKALIGGDQNTLATMFEMTSINPNELVLTPTNRRLKYAIQSVRLLTQAETDDNTQQVTIELIDRNGQSTYIHSAKLVDYSNEPNALPDSNKQAIQNCISVEGLETIECGLLRANSSAG